MIEKLDAIELEDEDGNVRTFKVRRLLTKEIHGNDRAMFSNEIIFRPGGGAVARRIDLREQTTAHESQADAYRRQEAELARLREQGMEQARARVVPEPEPEPVAAGGKDAEGGKENEVGTPTPGKRPPRGRRQGQKDE